ncbi:MAG: hypothetical protein P8R54_22145 [Myxococcota bacterium]|nr:hypothetical protein [Myxococcota bacterium]
MILLLLACPEPAVLPPADTASPETTVLAAPPLEPLEAPRLLRRMSLDLRGVLPSPEQLDAVEADPDQVRVYRDAWLEDSRLEEQLMLMLGEQWLTRVDVFNLSYFDYQLDPIEEYDFERAVGEEPLRLAAHVAVSGQPWSEVVTADYTIANSLLAEIWSLDYPEEESGWQVSHYTDGRPDVGVLASNGLWWRYWTSNFNYNRTRAATIFRLLLCEDMLEREISFSSTPSLLDESGTTEALKSNPACVNCHAVIDPVAATLFGFWWFDLYDTAELTDYHPERELMGESTLGVSMSWFGQPINGLYAMGEVVAEDPRFSRCAVETFATGLWRRSPELSDFQQVDALHEDFVDSGMLVIPLLKALTDSPTYQAGALSDEADEADAEREVLRRALSPMQLASTVADLTGFTWTWEGFEQLDNDQIGYRMLAGGVDGVSVVRPQQRPGVTWALVIRRLAQAAAEHAVTAELARPAAERTLLTLVDSDTTPQDEAFNSQLRALYWQLYAERPDSAWLQAAAALWTEGASISSETGWIGLLSAMLQDPRFVTR